MLAFGVGTSDSRSKNKGNHICTGPQATVDIGTRLSNRGKILKGTTMSVPSATTTIGGSGRTHNDFPNAIDEDPFTPLLDLEATYHAEGYATGVADGARAGRIEGRTFGLEKGFEKFAELGRLGGRGAVWDARLRRSGGESEGEGEGELEGLKGSERLKRQVERLVELTDPDSLSTVNDEDSVNAFDDRLREARAKATLVGKMVGEREVDVSADGRGDVGAVVKGKGGGDGEMEDFAGLPKGKRKE